MQTDAFAIIASVLGFECVRKLTRGIDVNKTATEQLLSVNLSPKPGQQW